MKNEIISTTKKGDKKFTVEYSNLMWKLTNPGYDGPLVKEFNAIRDLAADIHNGVNQHYDDNPYYLHLDIVANEYLRLACNRRELTDDDIVYIASCYFHDTIEDARLTYNDLKKVLKDVIGEGNAYCVSEMVYALTSEKGKSRKEREDDRYWNGIFECPGSLLIKLCDRKANMVYSRLTGSDMFFKYCNEWSLINDMIDHSKIFKLTEIENNYINILKNQISEIVRQSYNK